MTGQTISHYRILEKLGEGGMGEVWKAEDTRLKRVVALKFVKREFTERFEREARAVAALDHPHVCAVFDVGEHEGRPYLVMQFVEGKPLKCPLPLNDALRVAIQVADAVAAAHAKGIVHRDLKPSNILVDRNGNAKVLDFGLAKMTGVEEGEAEETRTAHESTEEGRIVGTVAYMSPEQAEGRRLDARSDIFSFGAVLYEMVTGRKAFQGSSRISILSAVMKQDPAPLEDEVPQELRRVISRCLKKDPERRFQFMKDLRVELVELKEESESGTLAAAGGGKAKRSSLLWAGLAACLLLAAVVVIWVWRGVITRGEEESASTPIPFTSMPGWEAYPTFSPEGNEVAFVWRGENQDNWDIYVKQIGIDAVARFTTDPAMDTSPAWSPDGRYIAFVRQLSANKAAVILKPQRGGPEQHVAELFLRIIPEFAGPYLAWTAGGKHLIAAGDEDDQGPAGLFLLAVESRELRRLLPPPERGRGYMHPVLSPDGRTLAFSRVAQWGAAKICTVSIGANLQPAGPVRELTNGFGAAWSPSGAEVVYSWPQHFHLGRIWRIAASGEGSAKAFPGAGAGSFGPVISARSGRMLFHVNRSSGTDVYQVEMRGDSAGPPRRLIASTGTDQNAEFSPDGKRVVFESDRSGDLEIWVANRDGSDPARLTSFGGEIVQQPHWSPDGKRIAFQATVGENREVFVVAAAGGRPQRLTNEPSQEGSTRWSRDGRWIYYESNRTGKRETWKSPAAGGSGVQVTREGGGPAQESSDGKWLIFAKPAEGIWRMPAVGGTEERLIRAHAGRGWLAVAGGIYFYRTPATGVGTEIGFYDLASKRERIVLTSPLPPGWGLSLSPDGKTLLYSLTDPSGGDLMLVEGFR